MSPSSPSSPTSRTASASLTSNVNFAPTPPAPLAAVGARHAAGTQAAAASAHTTPDADFTKLMLAINEVSDAQIEDMLTSIEDNARVNRELIQARLAAAEAQATAIAKQKDASWVSFAFGILGDVLLLAASVALTVATVGAATPLLALAVVNVALSTWDLIARIVQKTSGKDISPAACVAWIARQAGADEDTANKIALGVTISVRILLAVGSLGGAMKSALQIAAHVRTFMTTATVAGTLSQLGATGAGVYASHQGNEAHGAKLNESAVLALSEMFKSRLARTMQALDAQFSTRQEFMAGIRENLELKHASRDLPFSQFV